MSSLIACMIDSNGRTVVRWLPHMQSNEFLRASISRGERTDECWRELSARNERVHHGFAVLFDGVSARVSGPDA